MAKTATMNIRIDQDTKEKAEKLFASFGMNITDAVSIFIHKSIMEGGLPFEVRLPSPNADTIAAMKEADEIIRTGKSRFNNSDEMFKDLGL